MRSRVFEWAYLLVKREKTDLTSLRIKKIIENGKEFC